MAKHDEDLQVDPTLEHDHLYVVDAGGTTEYCEARSSWRERDHALVVYVHDSLERHCFPYASLRRWNIRAVRPHEDQL